MRENLEAIHQSLPLNIPLKGFSLSLFNTPFERLLKKSVTRILTSMSTLSVLSSLLILLHTCFTSSARPTIDISKPISWKSMKNLTEVSVASSCRTGNPIDDCWRCDPDWETHRRTLADCAIGFGRNSVGGRDGDYYVVTDAENDDPENPKEGTIRYAVMQDKPLWIIFDHDMSIILKQELLVKSYKTIDGRGSIVEVSNGPCITIENASNIIIHGIYIHNCVPAVKAMSRNSAEDKLLGNSDGDGISIFNSRDVWIDHCSLASCRDGLIDATFGSTAITISNNYMFEHNEVMLMGHNDDFLDDKQMQVTIAFNFFGEGLVQRMPRCRHGYFHVVNNLYIRWKKYAIGGSANPTINSQGNVFIASDDVTVKEVTKRDCPAGDEEWKDWNWRSEGDQMMNGAYFKASGQGSDQIYTKASSMVARPAAQLTTALLFAGVLDCKIGQICTN